MLRVAVISAHGCPLAQLGGKDIGGMNLYVRQVSRELGRSGIEIDVFTHWHEPDLPQVEELGENARVIHLQAGESRPMKDELYRHLPEFTANLCRFQTENGLGYDLLHSHYWLSGRVATFLSGWWGIPSVATFHTLGDVKNRARVGEQETELRIETERKVIASAHGIIATSAHEKNQMVRFYGAQPDKVTVIPCGVDLTLFSPMDKNEARRELGLSDKKIILFVGRIEPLKGIDLLLNAVAPLEDKSDLRILIIGGDSAESGEVARLSQLAANLGVGEKVTFLGAVEHEKLPLFYNAANVCVMPSYYESFGLVALEALACGTPVIASRVGGLPSIIRDGVTGYLIPWHCPEPFTERLELLLANEALAKSLGLAGRTSAAKFSWAIVAEQIREVYESLTKASPRRAEALSG